MTIRTSKYNSSGIKDETGKVYGRLKVKKQGPNSVNKNGKQRAQWWCECSCGFLCRLVEGSSLRNGHTQSCGCIKQEQTKLLNFKDRTGEIHGRLILIKRLDNGFYWCKCDCGREKPIDQSSIVSGATRSCGCLRSETTRMRQRRDITGQRFGMLTAIRFDRIDNYKKALWLFRCDCGGTPVIRSLNSVTQLRTKSCGCHRSNASSRVINEVGNAYGRLQVLREWGSDSRGRAVWMCKCNCGQTCPVLGSYLRNGDTKSCGCLLSEWARKLGKEVGRLNLKEDSFEQFCSEPNWAQSICLLYLVEVLNYYEKIGISSDVEARGCGQYTKRYWIREMPRACCWVVEQAALIFTKDWAPSENLKGLLKRGGETELREGLFIDETIDMLEDLADECIDIGWRAFYERYLGDGNRATLQVK